MVSNIYYHFHPYLGKIPILTSIFQLGWFNHQPVIYLFLLFTSMESMDIPSPGEELVSLSLRLKSGSFDKVKEAIEVGQAAKQIGNGRN